MKNVFVLALLVMALGFVSCTNKKAEEEAAKLKAYQDSVALVNFNDSVAQVALLQHIADSTKIVEDSLKLVAYQDSVALATKKGVRKPAPKPVVKPATIQDVKHDIKTVTPSTETKGRGK